MTPTTRRLFARARWVPALAALSLAVVVSSCGGGGGAGAGSTGPVVTLHGTFEIQPGRCTSSHGVPTGSWMVIVDSADSKTVANPDGGCANHFYTPLTPGTDRGIETGQFQANPTPTFDTTSNSLADAVITPVSFDGKKFGMGTSANDVQDAPNGGPVFTAPRALLQGSKLSVDLRSLNITYGGPPGSTCASAQGYGCWNLGSKAATGTYDAATHTYEIEWYLGESFTQLGDSMLVRFSGKFVPSGHGQ